MEHFFQTFHLFLLKLFDEMNSSVKHFQTKDSGINKNVQKYYFNKSTNAIKYKLNKNKN